MWKIAFRFPDSKVSPEECAKYWPFKRDVCSCGISKPRDPPLLFDLTLDPEENNPYDSSTDHFKDIVKNANDAVMEHKKTLTSVEDVLTPYKTMWTPHLQFCCNFPFCKCKEILYSDFDLT